MRYRQSHVYQHMKDFLFLIAIYSPHQTVPPGLGFILQAQLTMEASNSDRYKQDAAVSTALHQDSFASRGGILAMCGKNRTAHKAAVDDYFLKWDNGASEDAREVCQKYRQYPMDLDLLYY